MSETHTPTRVPVASGAGYIRCSCGWKSQVQDDGLMFDGPNPYNAEAAFRGHLQETQPMPKPEYLVAARDQFASAQRSLVMAVRALQETGYDFDKTIASTKEVIGDLAVTVEQINDHIG